MAWWVLWCFTSTLGGVIVSGIVWSTTSVRYGYRATFDLGFAVSVGGAIGVSISLVTGFYLRRFRRVWWAQAIGFGAASVLGLPIAYFAHILVAVPVSIGAYVILLMIVAQSGGPKIPEHQCARCKYDLRGSIEIGRCPECGTPFDASRLKERGSPAGAES